MNQFKVSLGARQCAALFAAAAILSAAHASRARAADVNLASVAKASSSFVSGDARLWRAVKLSSINRERLFLRSCFARATRLRRGESRVGSNEAPRHYLSAWL